MRSERRNARRANNDDSPLPRPLSVQVPRSRITGGGGLNGSPITPSTPPVANKRLHNSTQSQTTNQFPGINFNNSTPGSLVTPIANGKRPTTSRLNDSDDHVQSNRYSMDSINSIITNSTITGDGHVDESGHAWTEEQIAVIVRVWLFSICSAISCSSLIRRLLKRVPHLRKRNSKMRLNTVRRIINSTLIPIHRSSFWLTGTMLLPCHQQRLTCFLTSHQT